MKKIIKLTEVDLHRIVKESVSRILNEIGETEKYQEKLGKLAARKEDNGDKSAKDIRRYAHEKRMKDDGYDHSLKDAFVRGYQDFWY